MADLHAHIGNFLGCGEDFTHYGKCSVRDTLIVNCGGLRIRLVQREDVVRGNMSDFVDRFVESTRAEISNLVPDGLVHALKVLDSVCWLLSFASQSGVVRYRYEYPAGSNLGQVRAVGGSANYFRPVIDIRDGRETIMFVESCYASYEQLERKRKLKVVFDYLVQAERRHQPTELKLLISFVVLENLKSTFARSAGIPYKKGFFMKVPKPSNGDARYSFEELLLLMFKTVKMKKGLKRVIKLRNEMIHSGISIKSHEWQWKKYEHLQHLIREYILRLLNYRGYYQTFRGRGNERVEL